jgi:hypothetical protein
MFPVIARNPTCSTNRFNGFPIRSILIPDRKPVGCIHPSTVIYAVIAYPDSGRHRQPITFRPTQPRNHTKRPSLRDLDMAGESLLPQGRPDGAFKFRRNDSMVETRAHMSGKSHRDGPNPQTRGPLPRASYSQPSHPSHPLSAAQSRGCGIPHPTRSAIPRPTGPSHPIRKFVQIRNSLITLPSQFADNLPHSTRSITHPLLSRSRWHVYLRPSRFSICRSMCIGAWVLRVHSSFVST